MECEFIVPFELNVISPDTGSFMQLESLSCMAALPYEKDGENVFSDET